ncbi:MAG: hypothetical protein AAF763_18700, partial [Pseudomonadota bacterium]
MEANWIRGAAAVAALGLAAPAEAVVVESLELQVQAQTGGRPGPCQISASEQDVVGGGLSESVTLNLSVPNCDGVKDGEATSSFDANTVAKLAAGEGALGLKASSVLSSPAFSGLASGSTAFRTSFV